MTITNSGGVRQYDGQPINTKPSAQFGESLDDLMPDGVETPIRKDMPATEYPSTVPTSKYTTEEKK